MAVAHVTELSLTTEDGAALPVMSYTDKVMLHVVVMRSHGTGDRNELRKMQERRPKVSLSWSFTKFGLNGQLEPSEHPGPPRAVRGAPLGDLKGTLRTAGQGLKIAVTA